MFFFSIFVKPFNLTFSTNPNLSQFALVKVIISLLEDVTNQEHCSVEYLSNDKGQPFSLLSIDSVGTLELSNHLKDNRL